MTEKTFRKEVSDRGAEIDGQSFGNGTLNIDAPAGHVWAANGCHTICVVFENFIGQSWKTKAFDEAHELMAYGLEVCDDPNCDVCDERGAN